MIICKTNSYKTVLEKKVGNSVLIRLERKNVKNNSIVFMVGGVLKGDFPKLFVETINKNKKIEDLLVKTDLALLTAPLKKNLLHKTLPDIPEIKEFSRELNDSFYTISPYSMMDWFSTSLLKLAEDYSYIKIIAHSFSGLVVPTALLNMYDEEPAIYKKIRRISLLGPYIFNPEVKWGKFETIEKLHKIQKKLNYFYPSVDKNFTNDSITLLFSLFSSSNENKAIIKNALLNVIVHPRDEYINIHNKFEALYVIMKKLGITKVNMYCDENKLLCNRINGIHHSYHEMITNRILAKKILL